MRVEASRAGAMRRTRFGCGVAVLTALLVCSIIFLFSLAIFFVASGSSRVAASFIHAQPGARAWNSHSRLTILLLGKGGDSASSSTEAITVASLEPRTSEVRLLSIPPNLWVTIPGYGQGRIADAYGDGGAHLAVLTVESVLHVPIPYYAAIGPHAFTQLIDGENGVTINVPSTISVRTGSAGGPDAIRLAAGNRRLSGTLAVEYARPVQLDGAGIHDSMERQQALLIALKHRLLGPQNFFRIPTLLNTLGGSVDTNFPYNQVIDLAHTLSAVPDSRIQPNALDYVTDTVTSYQTEGQEVLLPDWQRIRSLAQGLFGVSIAPTDGAVDVVNGSGVTGQAATLASWLQTDNVPVRKYDSGPSSGYAHTSVVVRPHAREGIRSLASVVATLLQVPVVTGYVPQSKAPVTVLIGRDYQDITQQ